MTETINQKWTTKAAAYNQAAKDLTDKGANEADIEFEEFPSGLGMGVRGYAKGIGFSNTYNYHT